MGVSIGAAVGLLQAGAFRGDTSIARSWWKSNVLGWIPYGIALALAVFSIYTGPPSIVGIHETILVWLFPVTAGIPGLVTGLALKRIVEAQPPAPRDLDVAPAASGVEA